LQVLNPTTYPNAPIYATDVLADVKGNIWVAGFKDSGFSECARQNIDRPGASSGCPYVAKLSATGAALALNILGGQLRRGTSSQIVLAGDATGAVYAAAPTMEFNDGRNSGRINVTQFAADGSPGWSQHLPETWGVEPAAMAVDRTGRVSIGTDYGDIGGSVTMPTSSLGRFVYRLTPSGAYDSYVRLVEFVGSSYKSSLAPMAGLSVDVNGALTYMGAFTLLDGVPSQTCPGLDGGTCSDLFVKKFTF
jgi:hypothetical protein